MKNSTEIDMVLLTRGEKDLNKWIKHHCVQLSSQFGNNFNLIIDSLEPINVDSEFKQNIQISTTKKSYAERLYNVINMSNSNYVIIGADDDFYEGIDKEEILSLSEKSIGISPYIYFTSLSDYEQMKNDPQLTLTNSSKTNFDCEDVARRIEKFLKFPLPGDNGVYYGIFRTRKYRKVIEHLQPFLANNFVASDWVISTALLLHGPLSRSKSTRVLRNFTPMNRTLAEKNVITNEYLNEWMSILPLAPSLIYIRDRLLSKEQAELNWKNIIFWNIIRFRQIKQINNVVATNEKDEIDIIRFLLETRWEHIGGLDSV